jgi:hypothetical protein
MGGIVSGIGNFVKGAVGAVVDTVGSVAKAGINAVAGVAKIVTKPLDWVAPGLYKAIDSSISGVQKFANGVVDGAAGFVKGVAGAAVDIALAPSQIAANAIEGAWNALTGGDDDKKADDKPKAAGVKAPAKGKGGYDFTPPFNGTPRDMKTLGDLVRYGSKDDAIQAMREVGARAKAGDKDALKLLLEMAPATGFRRHDAVVAAAISMLKDVPDPAAKAAIKAMADEKTNDPALRDLAKRALG